MIDQHDFVAGLRGDPASSATVTFDVRWRPSPGADRVTFGSVEEGWILRAVPGTATVEWEASTASGFTFRSDPAATSTTVFAAVGRERNGVFVS